MLKQWLKEEYIAVGKRAADWREAIAVAGEPLVRAGALEQRYIDAMIIAVERLGPYIAIAPGIAIAHARPEDGVLHRAMGITTLDPPVAFKHSTNDPIKLVLTLAAEDHESHLDALGDLMAVLSDSDRLHGILQAGDAQSIYRLCMGGDDDA